LKKGFRKLCLGGTKDRNERVNLDRMLLNLHSAETPGALWKAVEPLALSLTGSVATMLNLNVISFRPMHVWSTKDHHKRFDEAAFYRLMTNRHVPDFVARFPNQPVFSVDRMFASREEWQATDFYKEFFAPFEWDDTCGFFFLKGGQPIAGLALMRRAADGNYSEEEIAAVEWMRRHVEVACSRVVARVQMRALSAEMEARFGELFEPGLSLDWNLRVETANRSAGDMLREWGSTGDIRRNGSESPVELPEPLHSALVALRSEIEGDLCRYEKTSDAIHREVCHPSKPELCAKISALLHPVSAHGLPMFHVSLIGPGASTAALSRGWTEAALVLSPAEKQVARLVCDGCSNGEIAKRLGKSSETVKRQVATIFSKLGVHSRNQLSAYLASPSNGTQPNTSQSVPPTE